MKAPRRRGARHRNHGGCHEPKDEAITHSAGDGRRPGGDGRGDQGRRGFAALATAAYVGGAAAAGLAAMFGDVAVDIAIGKGFPAGLFETHEDLAIATTLLFSAVAAIRLVTLWRGLGRGFVRATTGLAALGVVLLLAVAYEGGALVYDHGVNVAAVMR